MAQWNKHLWPKYPALSREESVSISVRLRQGCNTSPPFGCDLVSWWSLTTWLELVNISQSRFHLSDFQQMIKKKKKSQGLILDHNYSQEWRTPPCSYTQTEQKAKNKNKNLHHRINRDIRRINGLDCRLVSPDCITARWARQVRGRWAGCYNTVDKPEG